MLAIAIHAVQWACDAWKSWCEEASGRGALPMFAQRQELGRLIKANPQPEKKNRTQYVLKRPAAKVSKKPAAKVSGKPAAAKAKKAATRVVVSETFVRSKPKVLSRRTPFILRRTSI